VTGSHAEQWLLGAVIKDSRQFGFTRGLVAGGDFSDGRLGAIFDGIGGMVALGQPVDQLTVGAMFPKWGVIGLPEGVVFTWATADVSAFSAPEYARTVRADSVRRALRDLTSVISEQVSAGAEPVDVASLAASSLNALIDGAASGELATKTLAEILEGEDTYDWVIDGLLERRDRLIVTGGEGAGKTTFVRQLAVLAAAGLHPLKFTPIKPVRVLVVDAENTERQWRRAVRWTVKQATHYGSIDPAVAIHIVAGKRIDITHGSHLGEIHRLIDVHKPDIVFIGPLYKLVPRAINSDDDAAPLIVALDSLRERDVALVMEAHAGHAKGLGGDRDLRPRGSSALLGWPEFGFGLAPHPEDKDMVNIVRWRGDRDQRDWPTHMVRGNEWPWIPAAMPA